RPHEPRAQGGEGPRRRCAQARPREGVEGRRREGQGPTRGCRRDRRAQVRAGRGLRASRRRDWAIRLNLAAAGEQTWTSARETFILCATWGFPDLLGADPLRGAWPRG